MMYHRTQSGFSLVETLVAITILLVIIVGPMTIVSTTSRSTTFASEQVQAFFLAQEGAEIAQKARDDVVLTGFLEVGNGRVENPWPDFADEEGEFQDCFDTSGCGIEISETPSGAVTTPISCPNTGCRLYYDSSESSRSKFTHSSVGTTATDFYRTIRFETASPYSVRVVSEVRWFTGSIAGTQSVEVETYLFNVYEQP